MTIAIFNTQNKFAITGGLWQYDYGQKLRIQGLALPAAVEIHFSLQETGGESVTRVGVTKDGVTDVPIPDSMIENNGANRDYKIYAFIYLTDETSGETIRKIVMPVRSRPKPEAFNAPEDAELFREAIAAVNEAVENAKAAEKAVREQILGLVDMVERIEKQIPHVNILNIDDCNEGFAYFSKIGSDMTLVVHEKYSACNQVFAVNTGETYTLKWMYGAIYLYDSNKKLLSYNYADSIPYTVTVEQSGFMTVAGATSQKNNIMLVKGETLPDEYVPYDVFDIKTIQGNELEKQIGRIGSSLNPLKGVRWCAFGDSLTAPSTLANMDNPNNYVDYVSESLGLDVTNCGYGGSGYIKTENSFVNRVSDIPEDTEVLTVFGSFNDYEYIETSLGVMGDSATNTIYGCMRLFFDAVFARCPDIIVGIILPTKWGYLSEQKDTAASAKCDLYIKALLETAEYYSLPVLDLYHQSNLRPWDSDFASKYYKDDDSNGVANTVHPLGEAHKKFIAPKVESFIKSILMTDVDGL